MFDIVSRLPGTKYKVIALLSGGKDSCFNLLHCVANGHELVAVATLQPELGIGELYKPMLGSKSHNCSALNVFFIAWDPVQADLLR